MAGGIVGLARAEDPPSPQIVAACRPTVFARAAFEGQDPNARKAWMNIGSAFVSAAHAQAIAGNYERAMEQFDHAISLNPANPYFYMYRGMVRLRNGEFAHAVEDFDQAITLNPSSSMAFYGRGTAYSSMREYERAIEDFGEAISRWVHSTPPLPTMMLRSALTRKSRTRSTAAARPNG